MKVSVKELTDKFKAVLATSGGDPKDIDLMTTLSLEQDLRANTFSGVWDMDGVVKELRESKGKQYITEVDKPALKLINCNGRATGLVTAEVIPTLCDMAKQQGIAIIGLYNGGYQSMPEYFARQIAAQDLVGLVAANGGPQGVVPFGGSKDIMGTGPMAYSIPTNDLPIVFDAATSKYPWGAIGQAKLKGEKLPERSFLDKEGNWTTDPNAAISVVPFGEHKGYAINLMLEVLTGALVRGKSGLLQKSTTELGAFLIAIDPAAFGSLQEFKDQTTQLVIDIQAVKPAEGFSEVHVPGYKAEQYKQKALAEGSVEIADEMWEKLQTRYKELVKE